ncbi:MAG: enoyl-CoA hydratase-related protein [Tissierellia bacterium]|nr:enoyl-CoA hydratase-related protein [Tissierellia bacterium]
MDYQYLLLEKENGIATVTINKPKSLNALNSQVLDELNAMFTELDQDEDLKVVILTGEGKAFVAGADISEMSTLTSEEGFAFGQKGMDTFMKVERLHVPVIAAVNGFALGGGCELSLACDIRIASEKALFGQPEVGLGITPGFGGTQRLPRTVGVGIAKEMILAAVNIKADRAYEIGLVNKVVAPEELMAEAKKLAETIASKSPVAVKYAKNAINAGLQADIDTAMDIEKSKFGLCFATDDQTEGMAAFLEKRAPEFK